MESLYARDTPTAHDRKLKLSTSHEDEQVTLKAPENSSQEQSTGSLESLMDASTTQEANSTAASAEDTFGFTFSSLPEPQQPLDEQWRRDLIDTKPPQKSQPENTKAEDGRPAELSGEVAAPNSEKAETKTAETVQSATTTTSAGSDPIQPRRAGVASMPRKQKPAITINTGSGSTGVGAKRPPPTPVSPPTFSWNDILRVQNLIERCLQQYLSKNDILVTLKEQANVDPAFTNVVWQKLEEQNPMFFRAYSLQLQLKEQIIAFNYLVSQQKEMAAKGGKRLLHYSNINRSTANRMSAPSSLITTATTTTLPPISMDARTFLRTPIRSAKRTPAGKRAYNTNMYQLGSPSVALGGTAGRTALPPPSPLPLPSPIKTDLDTHAFFT